MGTMKQSKVNDDSTFNIAKKYNINHQFSLLINAPFPGVLMRSIGAAFLRLDALPDVNYLRGIYYSS